MAHDDGVGQTISVEVDVTVVVVVGVVTDIAATETTLVAVEVMVDVRVMVVLGVGIPRHRQAVETCALPNKATTAGMLTGMLTEAEATGTPTDTEINGAAEVTLLAELLRDEDGSS